MTARRSLWCSCCVLALTTALPHAWGQTAYYFVQRQKWMSQVSTNPLPVAYRFQAAATGVNLQSADIATPTTKQNLAGGGYQMSFATNFPALIVSGTNLISGFEAFNTNYAVGTYVLRVTSKLGPVPITATYTAALTNDFAPTDPAFTNVTPLTGLAGSQTFQWPVFSTSSADFSRFVLLEGAVDTNLLEAAMANGIDALTNTMKVLAWQTKLPPDQNSVAVSGIDTAVDHVAFLEFHRVGGASGDLASLSEVSSLSLNATLFFALRILSQPAGQEVEVGDPAVFTVVAIGARPVGYQWQRDGAPIPDATGPVLTIPAAKKTDAGQYTVVLTNAGGTVISDPATLTVNDASNPASVELSDAGWQPDGTFSFLVTGPAGATYTIQAAENLGSWTDLGDVSAPSGAVRYVDPAKEPARRFYRAKKL